MPRTDDHSPGDARKPYGDEGGPEGRHAKTHDVRREEATRSKPQAEDHDEFAGDLSTDPGTAGHVDESILASEDKQLRGQLPDLDGNDLKRLSILTVGTRLDQGSTYADLDDLARGPFKAMGDHVVASDERYIAKRDTDYEMWDRVVGQGRAAEIERPGDG
ncbi:MAG: hypothetical protein M3R71_00465 [Actinomycetota bacterium]|nr:hypothetical protein [Actinomycetota bacterium]